jgi:biotin transport system permease protein
MITGMYHPGHSVVHGLPAAGKVLAVVLGGTLLFGTADVRVIGLALAGVAVLYGVARIPWRVAAAQVRPVMIVLLILGAAQWLTVDGAAAVVVCLRLLALILLAALATLTTRVSDMVQAVEGALRPLERVGAPTAKISLAIISMALRFIPLLTRVVGEVREAQQARGLERNMLALTIPVLIRALHTADQMAEAIDARSGGA